MSYNLRPTILAGLLLLSSGCGLNGSPGGSQLELDETTASVTAQPEPAPDTAVSGDFSQPTTSGSGEVPVTPQDDSATEAALPGDSPLPTSASGSEAVDEDCTLTVDEHSTFPSAPGPGGAPAAPNQTLLIGLVRCVWQVQASSLNIQPEMPLFIAEVEIVEAKDVDGFINRLSGQEAQTIKIFSKTLIPPDAAGRMIEAPVTFRGDEHGGMHWVINDQLSIR